MQNTTSTTDTTTTSTDATNTANTEAHELAAQVQAAKALSTGKDGQTQETTDKLAELAKLGEVMGVFKPYDSQLPLAEITGTRIVKALYQKNPKTGTKAQENAYVRIPTKHLTENVILENIASLTPHILTWLQSLEDIVIKDLHKNGMLNVFCDGLSLDSIIQKLEETNESSRLSKDKIEAWFEENIESELAELFLDKMGLDNNSVTEQDIAKIETILAAYKAKFASLANPKVFIKEDDCKAMIKVINECSLAETLIGTRFISRLEKMSEKEEDLLLTL